MSGESGTPRCDAQRKVDCGSYGTNETGHYGIPDLYVKESFAMELERELSASLSHNALQEARILNLQERLIAANNAILLARHCITSLDSIITGEISRDWSELFGADYEIYMKATDAMTEAMREAK